MNYVTFETARRLKDAGFPQPIPERHQFWYDQDDRPPSLFLFMEVEYIFSPHVFAPTATDILKELGNGDYYLLYNESEFIVYENDSFLDWYDIGKNENPAEAAAQAWLSIYEKNNEQ